MARELGVSEATFHRWRNQYGGIKADDVKRLKELERENVRLKRIVANRKTRWGYRRARRQLRQDGWQINRKRVQRLWRQEGLRVPQKTRKKRRTGNPEAQWLRSERPNQLWALDFQYDQTADGRMLRFLNVVDEFTREGADHAGRAQHHRRAGREGPAGARRRARRPGESALRQRAGADRERPARLVRQRRGDDELHRARRPVENPFAESFNARVRDELLNLEEFTCLLDAQVLTEDWRQEYNGGHWHSSLGYQTPAAFAAACKPTT